VPKTAKTEVLETYGKSNGWLDGQPAAITRQVGKGRITYIGAWFDEPGMSAAAKWMTDISGVKAALGPVPDGIEVYPRTGERGTVFILVNLAKTEQSVLLPSEMIDVLEGGSKQTVTLPQYGVAVLQSSRRLKFSIRRRRTTFRGLDGNYPTKKNYSWANSGSRNGSIGRRCDLSWRDVCRCSKFWPFTATSSDQKSRNGNAGRCLDSQQQERKRERYGYDWAR
jgi:hypothetical protein